MDSKRFFYDFGKALYHVDAFYDDFAKKSNLAPTLLWILYALNDGSDHTQREICEDWALPKSTVNTIVMDLKAKGFIELTPIKGKRREMTIVLTDAGKDYADGVLKELYVIEKNVFEKMNLKKSVIVEELEKITDLLRGEEVK